jgi:hypothetical protein
MSFLKTAKTYLSETMQWERLGKPLVSDEVYAQRMAICRQCPHLEPASIPLRLLGATTQCGLCGCAHGRTLLGDALERATKACPDNPRCKYPDCAGKPRWDATITVSNEAVCRIPMERRALAWIDNTGQPVYGDVAELTRDDLVLTDARLVDEPPIPDCKRSCIGVVRDHFHVYELVAEDFTGEVEIAVDFEADLKALTWNTTKGKLRFEGGKPVGVKGI